MLVWQKPKSIGVFVFCLERHIQFNLVLVWPTKPIFFLAKKQPKPNPNSFLIWTNNKEGMVRRIKNPNQNQNCFGLEKKGFGLGVGSAKTKTKMNQFGLGCGFDLVIFQTKTKGDLVLVRKKKKIKINVAFTGFGFCMASFCGW